jgi:hypothetical protein
LLARRRVCKEINKGELWSCSYAVRVEKSKKNSRAFKERKELKIKEFTYSEHSRSTRRQYTILINDVRGAEVLSKD